MEYSEKPQMSSKLSASYWYSTFSRQHKENPTRFYIALLAVGLLVTSLILIRTFGAEIMALLESLSQYVLSLGYWGYAIMFSLIFVASFPFTFGYSLLLTLSGFTFGFMNGILVSYPAALTGAVVCFTLSRYVFSDYSKRMAQKSIRNQAIALVLKEKGFFVLLAIRILPVPFGFYNALFGAMDITFLHYTLATAIALVDILPHIFLGSTVQSLSDANIHNLHPMVIICMFGIPILIFIPTFLYFSAEVKKKMGEIESQTPNRPSSSEVNINGLSKSK